MKVLYVASKYHTNQVPVMQGWLRNGHEVIFISQDVANCEDHRDLEPIFLGDSPIFEVFFGIVNRLKHRTDLDELAKVRREKGFPPYFKMRKIIKDFHPDVVIVRERYVYNIIAYHIAKRLGIPTILYNQSPVWEEPRGKKSMLWKLVRALSPEYRMTVNYGYERPGMVRDPHTYFVPFVMEPKLSPKDRKYPKGGTIKFFFVARYQPWKKSGTAIPSWSMITMTNAWKRPRNLAFVIG